MDSAELAAMPVAQLYDEMAQWDSTVQTARAEKLKLHRELTRREQAEHAARLNPDRSLDQGIDLRLDMPGGQ